MRRLLLDNDGTNVFHHRLTEPVEQVIEDVVAELPSCVTTFVLCPNCCGKFFHPTKAGEVSAESHHLLAAHRRGLDPFGMLLRSMKATGREVLLTYRMNDVHGASDPNHPGVSNFKRNHPPFVVGYDAIQNDQANWMDYCLDYSHPEVREYYLTTIRELIDLYADTIDGLQLDWMRFPRHLSGSGEEIIKKAPFLTEFTQQVRHALDQAGKSMSFGVRIPTTQAGCKRIGLDVNEWANTGLIDFLVLSAFLATDCTPPVEEFRKEIPSSVAIYTDIQMMHGPQFQCPESLRAAALSQIGAGSDGVSLFNFPCWIEHISAVPYQWLDDLGALDTMGKKPLLFWVSHKRTRKEGIDLSGQLPCSLSSGEGINLTLSLPKEAFPIQRGLLHVQAGGDICVIMNGETNCKDMHLSRPEIFPLHYSSSPKQYCDRPRSEECRTLQVQPNHLQQGWNTLWIENSSNQPLEINRVQLAVW